MAGSRTTLDLGGMAVEVVRKDIKNVHLSVHPPSGRVRISAPLRMDLDRIRVFAISKVAWIKRQQRALQEQERETPREFIDRESHYVWGNRYLLEVVEGLSAPHVEVANRKLILHTRPGATFEKKESLLEGWYRSQLRQAIPTLLSKWGPTVGVSVRRTFVQRMKTRWGSCQARSGSIRLNTELAKKPRPCLEYIVVHEILHLIEPTHNDRFHSLLERFLPHWRQCRAELNRLPVRHEEWIY